MINWITRHPGWALWLGILLSTGIIPLISFPINWGTMSILFIASCYMFIYPLYKLATAIVRKVKRA